MSVPEPPTAAPVRRVAVLDHTAELGGAESALARLLDHVDPERFDVVVVLFLRRTACGPPPRRRARGRGTPPRRRGHVRRPACGRWPRRSPVGGAVRLFVGRLARACASSTSTSCTRRPSRPISWRFPQPPSRGASSGTSTTGSPRLPARPPRLAVPGPRPWEVLGHVIANSRPPLRPPSRGRGTLTVAHPGLGPSSLTPAPRTAPPPGSPS